MRVAAAATLQLCSEWWFWEICALVVGYLGKEALAAHVSTMSVVTMCFMPTIGVQSAAAALVGNSLGANLPIKAKYAAWLCVLINIGVWTATALVIFFSRGFIAEAYSEIPKVQEIMQKLILIYLFAGYFDNTQNIMGGALRGLGQVTLPAIVYLVSFYCLMLPVGCALAWYAHMGVSGIWWSMAIGTSLAAMVFSVALCRVDWFAFASEASEKMRQEGSREQREQLAAAEESHHRKMVDSGA
jgi:MATE family multidrug resistance protein